ncbi:MAG: dienelactone hydrolase family protein [Gemmataceae bacterium]|nr:dienelactone hydrolase family protein [Gemmataceae bacterium]
MKSAEPLPGTQPLTESGDLAGKMVAGIHTYLDRELAAAPERRKALWKPDPSSPEAYAKSVAPNRERLRKLLGVVDRREPPAVYSALPRSQDEPRTVPGGGRASAVRWPVLPGVDAEGILIEPPDGLIHPAVIAIPDATQTPEQLAGLGDGDAFAARLAGRGYRVLIPTLIDRADTHSGNPRLARATNQPHREFVQRMAYEMGRTLLGYEVQKVLAAADWFRPTDRPLGVIGYGDGGLVALLAAALDERFAACQVSGAFGSLATVWDQPIDRNIWGLLGEFGDAELGLLVAPRKLVIDRRAGPTWGGPKPSKGGWSGAAPGTLGPIPAATVDRELGRLKEAAGKWLPVVVDGGKEVRIEEFVNALGKGKLGPEAPFHATDGREWPVDPAARQKRQFDQLVGYTQKLWRDSDTVRKEYWKKADASSAAAWEKSCEPYREYFHTEVIGKLPDPTMPLNPRTRQLYDEKTWTGHEVMLDVYPDVSAYGILLLPKDLKPGERRPVVVCQHGLEGTPRHVIDPEKNPVYEQFARKLVERGYVVYAPQNPYIGSTTFRQIQRKAQPLKASLFSFIIRQHQRTLDWLETLPGVDPKRIAFYGLSYGGKTAMRVPAVEKRYCLSICSADFNEWVGKCVSVDLDRSYMWTLEYDMYEYDLGGTFNYAEMAYLIAPRPFMVERGHDDGVGIDEMVAYEYAKIRYLYANRLKIPDRTEIEFFPGPHKINGKGTFAFLDKHLNWPPR